MTNSNSRSQPRCCAIGGALVIAIPASLILFWAPLLALIGEALR